MRQLVFRSFGLACLLVWLFNSNSSLYAAGLLQQPSSIESFNQVNADFIQWISLVDASFHEVANQIRADAEKKFPELVTSSGSVPSSVDAATRGQLAGIQRMDEIFHENSYIKEHIARSLKFKDNLRAFTQAALLSLSDHFQLDRIDRKIADPVLIDLSDKINGYTVTHPPFEAHLISSANDADSRATVLARSFIEHFVAIYSPYFREDSIALWKIDRDATDYNSGFRQATNRVLRAYMGLGGNFERTTNISKYSTKLDWLTQKELKKIRDWAAANQPGYRELLLQEDDKKQAYSLLTGSFEAPLGKNGSALSLAGINQAIVRNVAATPEERRPLWEASKEIGKQFKPQFADQKKSDGTTEPGLLTIRKQIAEKFGYSSYFAMQASDYDLDSNGVIDTLNVLLDQLQPLYRQLHCYGKQALAKRYGKAAPNLIPADWIANPWGQNWPGITMVDQSGKPADIDFDGLVNTKPREWLPETAAKFFYSMGFPELSQQFWELADFYPVEKSTDPTVPARKKTPREATRSIDRGQDVRIILNLKPDWYNFGISHHEMGHAFQFTTIANDSRVPYLFKANADNPFHEAMGELFFTAATQPEYLQMLGLSLPRREETLHIPNASDKTIDLNLLAILLRQAYNDITAPINLPFFAGVVPQFERELYESDTLKPEDYNKHWYKLVAKYQGISPPQERPMEGFDAITKGHLIQAPASYYKYAFATVLRYQLHQYICTNILHSKDLHHCNYQGNQEVGDYLKMVMVESALHPFTEVVEKTTGHPLSSDGMIAYFQPLQDWLEIQNQGNQCEFGSSLASQLDRKSEGGLK